MLQFESLIPYIYAIGIAQALFLFFILIKKKENRLANKILAFTMIFFSIDLVGEITVRTGFIKNIFWMIIFVTSLPFLYGPLIYLHIHFLTTARKKFRLKDMLHFIPFFVSFIYYVFLVFTTTFEYKIALIQFTEKPPLIVFLLGNLIPVVGIFYLVLTIKATNKFNKNIRDKYSNIEKIDLHLLNYLAYGNLIVWLVVIVGYVLNVIFNTWNYANILIYLTLSIFLYFLSFRAYKQPEIQKTDAQDFSYKKSGLTNEKADEYLEKIINKMETDKLFLNPKLSLTELSQNTGISTHNISEIINTKLGQNFYDFVNKYRVEEVKRLIRNDKSINYNLLAHAFEAGFASKSAFNSSFKKFTGTTPSKFRDSLS
ncbi:MAG: hypothetical protein CR986_07845 [Ignavibacteriae bacterium]|nr:MAG: hypothetical protein CR986_07845 [Ignavibacteriota bacterium]